MTSLAVKFSPRAARYLFSILDLRLSLYETGQLPLSDNDYIAARKAHKALWVALEEHDAQRKDGPNGEVLERTG